VLCGQFINSIHQYTYVLKIQIMFFVSFLAKRGGVPSSPNIQSSFGLTGSANGSTALR
jgi:hypothetical protein